jgi:multiple sugar transport system substrate-binding protein
MKRQTKLSRRGFLQFSATVLASATLTACVTPQAPDQASGAAGEPDTAATNIRFSVWFGQGDIEVWENIIQIFHEANPSIQVAFEPLDWSQYWQKLQVGLAAGDPPDSIGMGVGVSYDYAGRKQVMALDDYLTRDAVDRAQWFPGLIEEAIWPKPGGSLYALPYRFTGSAFFINKTLFDEAGLGYPEQGWTWPTDYLELARQLTNIDTGQWGTIVPGGQLIEPFIATNDTSVLTPDLRNSNFLDPKVMETYQFIASLVCEHQVAPKVADVQGVGDLFLSGKVAMVPGAQWNIAAYRKIEDFEWDVVYNPLKEGVNKLGTYGGPDMLSIPVSAQYPEESWKFILFSAGDAKAQNLMSATAVPTLISQAADPTFVESQAELGPASYNIVVEQAQNAVGFSFSPGWNEWTAAAGQTLTEVYNCNMSVEDGLQKIDTDVQKILDSAFQALGEA